MTAISPEYVRPKLYPKQRAFLFTPARYSITEASTKSGKTIGCVAWLFEQAAIHGASGRNYWWVAPTHEVAKIAYTRMKRAIPRALYTVTVAPPTILLANGATIWFKSAENTDGLFGEDVFAAVIDEATRCKEEAWHAIRSTLTATQGPIRIIGNVKGRKNWAYQLARKAEAGAPDMAYFKLTAWDAVEGGVLAREEIEDAERVLPPQVFRELYLAEPSDDGGNPFGLDAIRKCIVPSLSTLPPVCYGQDLAKSVDWNVTIGLDHEGTACRFERWQDPWELTIAKVNAITRGVPTLVDSTGAGDPVLESLRKLGQHYSGYHFSQASKQQLMEELAIAIHQQEVGFPDGPIRAELDAFEYEYTRTGVRYSAPQGQHDDCVIGLALANHHRARGASLRPRFLSGHSSVRGSR